MRSVALLLFGIRLALTGRHSLQYFCTAVHGDINISKFQGVGLVDGQQFMYFDSDTMKAVPKTEWIRQNEGEEYWNKEAQISIDRYNEYENIMKNIINQFNQSITGVYTFQMMFGCELDDDDGGTSQEYLQYGVNGEDWISLDLNKISWSASNPYATVMKNQWDAKKTKTQSWITYLRNECYDELKKYVGYGKDSLERKVAPKVSLLQKNSSSPVICHATGFYPKNIIMTWKKNHEEHYEDVEVSETLPNADGTFQKSLILSVKPKEWKKNPDVYRCVIQHVGAEKEIVILLNENNVKSNSAYDNLIVKCLVFITVAIVVGCVVALIVFAVKKRLIVCRKFREVNSQNSTGYVKGSTKETALEMTEPEKNSNCN